jgi:LysM repeat protein
LEENMTKRAITIFIVVLALAALMSGCVQRASTAPQATPTLIGGGFADPVDTASDDMMLEIQLTATAAAQEFDPNADPNAAPTEEGQFVSPFDATPTPDPFAVGPTPEPVTVVPPTQPVVVSEPGVRPATYTLQQGEFPYCIARRYNLNPADLMALNGLSDAAARSLSPGLVLKIPTTGTFPGQRWLKAHPTTHTVGLNETIYSIACQYGDVDPMQIASANGLSAPYTLTVGQSLQIP